MCTARPRILFLCTGNSCRSQIAEGWALALHAGNYDVFSAGLDAHGLNPLAVEVMQEVGVDIAHHRSKRMDDIPLGNIDFVITVCEHADKQCPSLPIDCRKLYAPFEDPPRLAQSATTKEEALGHYRQVRDKIKEFVASLPDLLENQT